MLLPNRAHNGTIITLQPGESFTDSFSSTTYFVTGDLVVTNKITNYGIFDKAKITAPNLPIEPEFLCGDVDNNNIVNIIDALIVARIFVGYIVDPEFNLKAADVNNSGSLDIVDALMIAQYYVGLITTLNCPG